jgi:hypothetical protein
MKKLLQILFTVFLLIILWATVRASLSQNILDAGRALWPDKWFQATLIDAYLAFFTFYCWVFYKEARWYSRASWFLLIMGLGNIAIAGYVLIQLWKAKDGSLEKILLRS